LGKTLGLGLGKPTQNPSLFFPFYEVVALGLGIFPAFFCAGAALIAKLNFNDMEMIDTKCRLCSSPFHCQSENQLFCSKNCRKSFGKSSLQEVVKPARKNLNISW